MAGQLVLMLLVGACLADDEHLCGRTCSPSMFSWLGGCKWGQSCTAGQGQTGVCQCPTDEICSADTHECAAPTTTTTSRASMPNDCTQTCKVAWHSWNGGCATGQSCKDGFCQCNSADDQCAADGSTCIHPSAQHLTQKWEWEKATARVSRKAPVSLLGVSLGVASLFAAISAVVVLKRKFFGQRSSAALLLQSNDDEENHGENAE
eukprot:CAMPEP_0197664864 /NCGR_PEP_ID=MMETSP1338-20131121/58896_1 /TAXON_ID=43686 ORGANISM="Pelagodinium beii, Strain RCC1491" /NCGR_SAMPLE_ID=MMETSP1338 /ASSEMBLY_ACC=CAM_ASM_000754 /LENGTH=205 /DNA_ID=CAMNT_0043243587 /DNA_START=63 /DNA_END=680 /DNA_ORIENTATION=-